jgi:hypothetical protein
VKQQKTMSRAQLHVRHAIFLAIGGALLVLGRFTDRPIEVGALAAFWYAGKYSPLPDYDSAKTKVQP